MQGVGTKGHEKVSPWEFKDQLGGLWSTPGRVIGDIIAFGPRVLFLEWTYLSLIFSSIFLGGGVSQSLSLSLSPYLSDISSSCFLPWLFSVVFPSCTSIFKDWNSLPLGGSCSYMSG